MVSLHDRLQHAVAAIKWQSPFEPVPVVFGLLLSLGLTEVVAGLSRPLKASRGPKPVRIGWLVPLLGLVVVLDLSTFWLLGANVASWVGSFVLAC